MPGRIISPLGRNVPRQVRRWGGKLSHPDTERKSQRMVAENKTAVLGQIWNFNVDPCNYCAQLVSNSNGVQLRSRNSERLSAPRADRKSWGFSGHMPPRNRHSTVG